MSTLGFGDIYPVSTFERIYVIFVTFIACGVFAYTFNKIGNIFQEMSIKANDFKEKMSSLSIHMKKRNLSNNTQIKVRKYYEYLHME